MPAFIQHPRPVDPDHDYVVAVTRLTVRSPTTAFAVLRRLRAITAQLRHADGVVVFGLRAQLLRMTFSTYGVFESRRDLTHFLTTDAHGAAMVALKGRLHHVEARTFVRRGDDLPSGRRALGSDPGTRPAPVL